MSIDFPEQKVRCSDCNTPIFQVEGGSLIIKSKHHGERHLTAISLGELINICWGVTSTSFLGGSPITTPSVDGIAFPSVRAI